MNADNEALFTDLYELTMLQAYYSESMRDRAVFDLYVRELPPTRNFLVACGIDDALRYLQQLSFSEQAVEYLGSLVLFTRDFLDELRQFRFTGSVFAVPEGTPVFAREPILEVVAPLPEAQLVETYLLNQVTFQTLIASKGARVIAAAQGRPVVDFGTRRTHGTDAALKAARALYVAGFASTSNVLAGQLYGIPVVGTMAHSYIEAHESELDAFRAIAASYPNTILLIDTYDVDEGVRNVARLARELGDEFRVQDVRLDSGDLVKLAFRTRELLDEARLRRIGIVASGGLDEYSVAGLIAAGAPIDGFAVGTNAGVSADAPKLDSTYKLAAYAGQGRMKLSEEKETLPSRKQIYRRFDRGAPVSDVIGLPDEKGLGEPLLVEVMRDGKRLPAGSSTLEASRERARSAIASLPERLRCLERADPPYEVAISPALEEERARSQSRVLGRNSSRWK